jgi:hypothetical protein
MPPPTRSSHDGDGGDDGCSTKPYSPMLGRPAPLVNKIPHDSSTETGLRHGEVNIAQNKEDGENPDEDIDFAKFTGRDLYDRISN